MTLPTQQRIWALAREAQALAGGARGRARHEQPDAHLRAPAARASAALEARLRAAWDAAQPLPREGRVVELPVVYGGEGGPHMADVVAHTGLQRRRDRRAAQRAALSGVRARQPSRLLLPGRHGPAHRHAAPQGAGAEHSGRRGVDRRGADRRVGLGRPERLEHHRQHRRCRFFDPTQDPPAMLQPGDMIRFRVERVIR